MIAHQIVGNAVQSVMRQRAPGQTPYAEPGKFLWKTQNVSLKPRLTRPASNQAGAPAAEVGLLAPRAGSTVQAGSGPRGKLLWRTREGEVMGFMDKVKAQAEQAVVKAQAGVAQGQAKLETRHAGHQQTELLRALGAAVYAEQRQGAGGEAVASALAALDEFNARQGSIDLSAAPQPGTAVPIGPQAATPAPGAPQPGTPSGDVTL